MLRSTRCGSTLLPVWWRRAVRLARNTPAPRCRAPVARSSKRILMVPGPGNERFLSASASHGSPRDNTWPRTLGHRVTVFQPAETASWSQFAVNATNGAVVHRSWPSAQSRRLPQECPRSGISIGEPRMSDQGRHLPGGRNRTRQRYILENSKLFSAIAGRDRA